MDETTPQQHHCNLWSRAHLIADSVVQSLVPALPLHLTNAIIHQTLPLQQAIANTHQMCNATVDETMGTPLEYRHLIKWDKKEVWVTPFANELPITRHP